MKPTRKQRKEVTQRNAVKRRGSVDYLLNIF